MKSIMNSNYFRIVFLCFVQNIRFTPGKQRGGALFSYKPPIRYKECGDMKIGQIDEMHKMLVSKDSSRNQRTYNGYQPIITV